MSRFYASIQGNRGKATRQGSGISGIEGHIRGWNLGAYVKAYINKDGEDEICVHITGGSSDPSSKLLLGFFKRVGDRLLFREVYAGQDEEWIP